ncbi:hypothetical protein, partial [Acidihalobacter prosperus]
AIRSRVKPGMAVAGRVVVNPLPTHCQPIANPLPTHCQPIANPLPTRCQPVVSPLPNMTSLPQKTG